MVLQDETHVKLRNISSKRSQLKRMKKAILDGDWADVQRLLLRTTFRNIKPFKYALLRQQFLELIDSQQHQPALLLLQRHLKPLEPYATTTHEFRDLCYLLTCKTLSEATTFRDWDGINASRTALIDQYSRLLDFDTSPAPALQTTQIPPNRLLHLLQQALAFQILSARHMPRQLPHVNTLLEDFESVVVPNQLITVLRGHRGGNVKCVTFVGEEGDLLASGGGDHNVRLWKLSGTAGHCSAILQGHTGRIWDLSATINGGLVASAAADAVVRIWDCQGECKSVLKAHDSDVYAVNFHPGGNAVVSAGYDRCVRLWDVETQQVVKTFSGHDSSVSSVVFNARGNMIISASKDCTIKFWDMISGLCVKTIGSHLGEVTSVATNRAGTLLVSCSKDNSNRLWDIRMNKAVKRFKGHQNTSKNFIRAAFGPLENVVVGGSEDGLGYVWDVETTDVVTTLGGGGGGVMYDVAWNARQSLLACSGQEGGVGLWGYDESIGR